MALNIKAIKAGGKAGVEQKNIEPGTYPARLVQIIDLGLQAQRPYQGKEKKPAHEIMLTYELVDEFMKDAEGNDVPDKPRWISETLPFYGLDADKAKSTQRYLTFDPNMDYDGDFTKAIESPCNVTVINNPGKDGRVYDNVATISAMRPRDAANCPALVNKPKVFDLSAPDIEVFNALPDWLQDKIRKNLNYEGSALQKLLGAGKQANPAKGAAPKEKPKAVAEEAPEGNGVDEDAPF